MPLERMGSEAGIVLQSVVWSVMTKRFIISLESGANSANIANALRDKGAQRVERPEALPDVLIATVEESGCDAFLRDAGQVKGVRVAEPDQMRFST